MGNNFANELIAKGIKEGVAIAEADKAAILGTLDVSEAGIEKAADTFVDGVELKGAAALLGGPIRQGIKNAIHSFLMSSENKQGALFDLLAADANAFAEKLAAS